MCGEVDPSTRFPSVRHGLEEEQTYQYYEKKIFRAINSMRGNTVTFQSKVGSSFSK